MPNVVIMSAEIKIYHLRPLGREIVCSAQNHFPSLASTDSKLAEANSRAFVAEAIINDLTLKLVLFLPLQI